MSKITAYAALSSPADGDVLAGVDVSDTSMASSGTTKALSLASLRAYLQGMTGLLYLTGGGTITTSTITTAQGNGYVGLYLDPRNVWDMSGVSFNGIQDFRIESRMTGSIGWTGNIEYNTSGYITTSTGSPTNGIQVYASTPGGSTSTQGVIFKNCVFVGSNSHAVIHYGGGQRRCGLVDSLVYNTASTTNAYAVAVDSALSDNNSENNIFSFTGGGGLAGAYAALGIGVFDQTQHANDTWYYGMPTSGGTYSIVKQNGGGHTFVEWYDRSSPATATVWNDGGARLIFLGGELQNTNAPSVISDNSAAKTILIGSTVTNAGHATTMQISAGSVIMRDFAAFNGSNTIAISGTGVFDVSDCALDCSNASVSGTAGTLVRAHNYPGQGNAPVVTGWSGTTAFPS